MFVPNADNGGHRNRQPLTWKKGLLALEGVLGVTAVGGTIGQTGQTTQERMFFAMMDLRFGMQWMHTMQEEVVMPMWRQWMREWHRREKTGG